MSKIQKHENDMWDICTTSYDAYKDGNLPKEEEEKYLTYAIKALQKIEDHVRETHDGPKAATLRIDLNRAMANMMNQKYRLVNPPSGLHLKA